MARSNTQPSHENSREPRAPEFLAWHVSRKGESAYWSKVGAAWVHKDSKGYTLQLDSVPVGGRIVLRAPLSDAASSQNEMGRN